MSAAELLVNKAQLLTLTAPEMTVLVDGVLNANVGQSQHGVFTQRPETLTNEFFVNRLDMSTEWKATSEDGDALEGRDRATGELKWSGTRVDLIFGSNSRLWAIAEVDGQDDVQQAFVRDFVAAWEQGHERGPLRPCLILAERSSFEGFQSAATSECSAKRTWSRLRNFNASLCTP